MRHVLNFVTTETENIFHIFGVKYDVNSWFFSFIPLYLIWYNLELGEEHLTDQEKQVSEITRE